MGDGFYRSKRPNQQYRSTTEGKRSLTDGWVRYFTTWPFRRLWAHRSQNVRCNCQQEELTWSYPTTENDPNVPCWVYICSTHITKCNLCIVIKGYVTCGDPTTSPTRWPASIACSLRESSSRSPYWYTKSSTDLRRGTRPFHTCSQPTQLTFCRHQSPGSAYQQTVDCW